MGSLKIGNLLGMPWKTSTVTEKGNEVSKVNYAHKKQCVLEFFETIAPGRSPASGASSQRSHDLLALLLHFRLCVSSNLKRIIKKEPMGKVQCSYCSRVACQPLASISSAQATY